MTSEAYERKVRIVTAIAAVFMITIPITAIKVIRSIPKTERIQEQQVRNITNDNDIWRCKNGDKIDVMFVCDGKIDCTDASDETYLQCRNLPCENDFQCVYGACVPMSKKCDKKRDCADGSDEFHPDCDLPTTKTSVCDQYEFECDDHQCINAVDVCTGKPQCPDNSDEKVEVCGFVECSSRMFKCAYGACISKKKHCNGVDDCLDGSDEWECANSSPKNPPVYDLPCKLDKNVKGTPYLLHQNITINDELIRHSEYIMYLCKDGKTQLTHCKNGSLIGDVLCKDLKHTHHPRNKINHTTVRSIVPTSGPRTTQHPRTRRS